jgi:hypothetical protein
MNREALRTHLLDQAVAAYNENNRAVIQRVYNDLHEAGMCETAHALIAELNQLSMLRLALFEAVGQPVSIGVFPIS